MTQKMKKIVWKDEFSIGVRELDLQHQKIIKIINLLIDKPRMSVKSQNIASALSELTYYVSEHFLLEEQLLGENGYQDLLEHSKKHTAYSQQITDFCTEALHRNNEVPSDLLNFLTHWWTNHILNEDMKYKPFFEEKGIK